MEGQKRWVEEEAIVIDDDEDGQDEPSIPTLHPRSSSMTVAPPLPDPHFNPPADSHILPTTLHRYHSESSTGETASGSTSRQRSPSLSSPPPPPSFFNPPADLPSVPLDLLSPPVSAGSSNNGSFTLLPSTRSSPGLSLEGFVDQRRQSTTDTLSPLHRPDIRALQKVSSDSVNRLPASHQSSFSSNGGHDSNSDAGEHLVEARERLIHEAAVDVADEIKATSPFSNSNPFDLNVTSPTPPLQPSREVGDDTTPAVPPLRRGSTLDQLAQDEPERAWDSVWPAPGTAVRPPAPPVDTVIPTFPIAPISPFVTPVFSPALAGMPNVMAAIAMASPPSPRARPTSPTHKRSPSPRQSTGRASPTADGSGSAFAESSTSGRRSSFIHSMSPLARSPTTTSPVPITRHARSKSGTSPNGANPLHFPRESLERILGTPPTSPHGSPTRRNMSLSSASRASFSESSRGQRSGSPTRHSSLNSSSTRAAPRRLSEIQPSPPLVPPSLLRPRGSSVSADRPVLPEPPDSGKTSPRSDSAVVEETSDRPHWHRTGSTNSNGSQSDPFPASEYTSPGVLPPINLPPPLAMSPVISSGTLEKLPSQSLGQTASTSRLSRPTALRRAISDYETKSRQKQQAYQAIPLNRSLSDLADVARPTKRSPDLAEIASPTLPGSGEDPDTSRVRKSPRRSPKSLPVGGAPSNSEGGATNPSGMTTSEKLAIVDEGDVLPSNVMDEVEYDITFDDEGLSTLERIFLLSKSDFPFHRAYVARVLGDLLYEVDPCESVEYVLPLVNGFTMDEEETVKEALVSELHRILWYFFSYCRMYVEGEEDPETLVMQQPELGRDTPSTSLLDGTAAWVQGLDQASPMPMDDDEARRPSLADTLVGSSRGSDIRRQIASRKSTNEVEADTPGSGVSQTDTLFSPSEDPLANPRKDDGKKVAAEAGPLHNLPPLPTNFFTPLLGALLLNSNPSISEMCRSCVVKIIGRIRGKAELDPVEWGIQTEHQAHGRRTYVSQTGLHSHWTSPLDTRSATIIEAELMRGIVVGMGSLETEMPYDLLPSPEEDLTVEEREAAEKEADVFKEQLLAEALAGRATSLNLIASLCEFYSGDEAVERGFAAEIARCPDGDVTVKAEGAVALKSFAEIAPAEHVKDLLPVFEALMTDEDNHVRQNAACSLPALCRRIDSDPFRRSFAIKAVETLTRGDADVRMAALETLGEVIYAFKDDPRGPPSELLQVFRDDGNVSQFNQEDCDYLTCFNFPGVCLTLGPKRWPELCDLYHRLLDRANERIFVSIAAALHEVAKILDTPDVVRDLLPAFKRCMTSSEEVRERLFEHVDIFLSRLDQTTGGEMLLSLESWWKTGEIGGWRAREQFAKHIPDLLKSFPGDEAATTVLRLTDMALHDTFASVREAATQGVSEAYSTLGDGVAKAYRDLLVNLGDSSSFKQRITFLRCLREFAKVPLNRAAFEEHFVPLLPRFITDVTDVRLALAQATAALFGPGCYETYPDAPPLIAQIVFDLSADESVDIRDVISKLDVTRLSELHPAQHAHSLAARPAKPVGITDQDVEMDYFSLGVSPKSVAAAPLPQPIRRPSAEVAAKMDGMQLEPGSGAGASEELVDPFIDPRDSQ